MLYSETNPYSTPEKLEGGAITKEEYDAWKASFSGVEYGLVSL